MSRRVPVRTLLILLAALLLIVGLRKLPVAPLLNQLIERSAGTGVMGLAAFALVYAVAAVLFLPGSVLTLGAGAAFGLLKGTLAVSVGATLGAGAAFLIGRYLARSRVARWASENPKFAAIDAAVGREGGRIVFLTRLSPLFPYNLLNYLFGVTSIGFWSYLLASWAGMLPGTLLYVYLGFAGRTAAQATVDPGAGNGWKVVFWGVGLATTGLLTYYLTRLARRALAEKTM